MTQPTSPLSEEGLRGLVERLTTDARNLYVAREIGITLTPTDCAAMSEDLRQAAQALTPLVEERERASQTSPATDRSEVMGLAAYLHSIDLMAEAEAMLALLEENEGLRAASCTVSAGIETDSPDSSTPLEGKRPFGWCSPAEGVLLNMTESLMEGLNEDADLPEDDRTAMRWQLEALGQALDEVREAEAAQSSRSPPISRAAGAAGNLAQDDPSSLSASQAEIVRLREALSRIKAFALDEERMTHWSAWRKMIADGFKGSHPRDCYEATLSWFVEEADTALLSTQAQADV